MKYGGTTLGCIAGAFALWTAANAPALESSGSPYQGIVDRNVFGLKDPPPPPPPPDNKPPPPNIKLQGITTIFGNKRALLKVSIPPRPGVKPEEQSYILAEGQRDGEVEVLEINEKQGTVKVSNYGSITNLNFKDNGVVIASGPAPGMPVPGGPIPAAGGVPPPPVNPAFTQPGTGFQPRSIPMNRNPRLNPTGAAVSPGGYGGAPAPTVYSAVPTPQTYGTTPVATTPGTVALSGLGMPASTPKPQQNWPPETPMTPEQAAIMEAAYSLKYQKEISQGIMPPIPGGNPILDPQNTPGQNKTQSGF